MPTATLVLGASPRAERYANLAVRRLVAHGHAVIAVGRHAGSIGELSIQPQLPTGILVDTVTLYVSPINQVPYHDALLALLPRRVIFNPGTEDALFAQRLRAAGIEAVEACTLVMLSAGTY